MVAVACAEPRNGGACERLARGKHADDAGPRAQRCRLDGRLHGHQGHGAPRAELLDGHDGHCVAGDDDRLDPNRKQKLGDGRSPLDDEAGVSLAVRGVGRVCHVKQVLCGQLTPDGVENGETANTGIEDADGRIVTRCTHGSEFRSGRFDVKLAYALDHRSGALGSVSARTGVRFTLDDQLIRRIPILTNIANKIEGTGNPDKIVILGFGQGLFHRRNRVRLNTNIEIGGELGSRLRQDLRIDRFPAFLHAKSSDDEK